MSLLEQAEALESAAAASVRQLDELLAEARRQDALARAEHAAFKARMADLDAELSKAWEA